MAGEGVTEIFWENWAYFSIRTAEQLLHYPLPALPFWKKECCVLALEESKSRSNNFKVQNLVSIL